MDSIKRHDQRVVPFTNRLKLQIFTINTRYTVDRPEHRVVYFTNRLAQHTLVFRYNVGDIQGLLALFTRQFKLNPP